MGKWGGGGEVGVVQKLQNGNTQVSLFINFRGPKKLFYRTT